LLLVVAASLWRDREHAGDASERLLVGCQLRGRLRRRRWQLLVRLSVHLWDQWLLRRWLLLVLHLLLLWDDWRGRDELVVDPHDLVGSRVVEHRLETGDD